METETVQKRIADLLLTARGIELTENDKENNAILLTTTIDNVSSGVIIGSADNIAITLYAAAVESPEFAAIIKFIATKLN